MLVGFFYFSYAFRNNPDPDSHLSMRIRMAFSLMRIRI